MIWLSPIATPANQLRARLDHGWADFGKTLPDRFRAVSGLSG